jgi:hypothetical protein
MASNRPPGEADQDQLAVVTKLTEADVAEAVETLDHITMGRALIEGTAVCLSRLITRFVRYQDAWWGNAPFAWVKLTDRELLADLDTMAVKLAAADAGVRNSAERHAPLSHGAGEEGR